jgi:asparagine synthase (glutamine-hydrolysing)
MNTELLKNIQNAIRKTVPKKRIGIAFSGGVDSTLISKILSNLQYDVTLLTIGFSESHDILFAKEVNEKLSLPHHILEIDESTFECIAFYYVSKLAKSLNLDTVVTANGIDELFCGYNAYREVISKGESQVNELMNSKLENEVKMMKAVNLIASEFGVKILQPLLSSEFIEFAKSIPVNEKILGSEDMVRKHAIRKLASYIGVPEVSYTKRKKALQYGTQIHKKLLKTR